LSDAYEGPECQEKYTVEKDDHYVQMHLPKPNYNIRFHNADNVEVGVMDFNGEGLAFEGNANESAIVFINWIDTVFRGRLQEERNKARQECLDLYSPDDLAKDWADKINERIEK
jgi:hypothetical protein